jgi:tetratricopeptide (TPR) repeat protein
MRSLLERLGTRPMAEPLASALIEFSRGMPGVLVESLRLVELEGELHLGEAGEQDGTDSVVQALIARQLAHVSDDQRALLECASLIGQRVPLDVLTAPPLCGYLALGERASLSLVVELADRGVLLVWDGEDTIRFASPHVRQYLREQARLPVNRRDHLHIAESWQATRGESRPARLATHYLAGREPERALSFALRSAQELSRSAAYPEAVQSYQLALEALEQMPGEESADREYDILRAMSLAAERAGDWGEALIRLKEALALSDGDAVRQAEIYAGLGWLHFQRGEVQAALQNLDRSAGLYRSLGDVQGRAQVEYYLGVLYGQQKEWQRAVACFERYLETSQEFGFDEGRASAYTELGNLYRLERKWAQAEAYLQQGIDLAQAEGDYAVLAQGYHYLGSCYALQGKPDSIDVLGRALEIVRKRTKQPAQEARIQNTLAEGYVRLNRWSEAEAAFRASAEIKARLGDKAGLAMTYGGLGRLYYRQWRFDLAVEHLQRDLALLAEEFEANVAWIQQLTNVVGEVWRLEGRLDEAAGRFREALALADRIPDGRVRVESRGYTHLLLARLALDRGDLVGAESECELSLDVLTGTWADGEVHRTAARLARARGDLEHARQHLDQALAVAERGEEIDRALTYLEEAHYCRDVGDVPGMRRASKQAVRLAQRLQNVELERRARQLARAGEKV